MDNVAKSEYRFAIVLVLIGLMFVALAYLPDVGHGFLKDDFGWVRAAERIAARPWTVLTADAAGTFYRPIVTLSFAADYALYGLGAGGFGVTNLLLLIGCAVLIALLLRSLGLSTVAAVAAAVLWMMNPHGINMSVLWLSGRTSLIMTLLACGAIICMLRGWRLSGMLLIFGATLSKEDALLVPLVILACLWCNGVGARRLVTSALLMAVPIASYLALRFQSHALTPATAPSFYQLSWDPALVAVNALSYLDRASTAAAALTLLTLAAYRVLPRIPRQHRRLLGLAAFWFVVGITITARIPVRSSLYAIFPSIGPALAFAVIFELARAQRTRESGDVWVQTVFALFLLCAPLYHTRNERWVKPADVSRRTMVALVSHQASLPQQGLVTLEDEPVRFANFSDAFGTGATDAVRLFLQRPLDVVVVTQGDTSTGAQEVARFRLANGEIERTH